MRAHRPRAGGGRAGIKRVINGPMIWSPDASALMGPVPELTGYFCCNGIIPGFSQSGGLGAGSRAEWMVRASRRWTCFGWDMDALWPLGWQGVLPRRAWPTVCAPPPVSRSISPARNARPGGPCGVRPVHGMQAGMGAKFGLNSRLGTPSFL